MSTEPMTYDPPAGEHVRDAIAAAVGLAIKSGRPVRFAFNGRAFTAEPTDSLGDAYQRWHDQTGRPILTPEQEAEEARRSLDELTAGQAKAIAAAKAPTEAEMREAKAPWPDTVEDLAAYVAALVDRPHDYGTSAYAMSLAAVAAFNFVGKRLGTTGFQASCADLDILRRTRGLDGPFGVVKAENMLYPQYDIPGQVREWLDEWRPWAAEQARKRLAERGNDAHPDVLARWRELAGEPPVG